MMDMMQSPLHTPEELAQLSNAAHIVEGILLLVFGGLIIAQAFGYLQKGRQRYIVPVPALVASLVLAGFLFIDHFNELPAAWNWIMNDMQQQQHFWIGVILGIASIAAIAGLKLKQKWLDLALPVAFAAIGVLFLTHPQHGTDTEAARGLLIHRIAGTSLILAGLAQGAALFVKQWRKWLLIFTGVALAVSAVSFISYREPLMTDMSGMNHGAIQSHRTYNLNLMEGMTYQPNQSSELMFDIRDETGKVLKDYDSVHEKQMHLIVVRKDRAYFQHVHPNFDKNSGMFAITGFKFPTDGEYRVFADFTPSSSQMGPDGMKLAVTAYKDVKVGSGQYTTQPIGDDKLMSDTNGFSTALSLLGDDTPNPQPYATLPLTLGVEVNKDGVAYKNLQPYLGALGHMVVLGPNLEYIHAHAMTEASANQTGLIVFSVTFPDPGQYKIYLQTQADGQVNTTDYTYTVKPMPTSNTNANDDSMPGMDMSH